MTARIVSQPIEQPSPALPTTEEPAGAPELGIASATRPRYTDGQVGRCRAWSPRRASGVRIAGSSSRLATPWTITNRTFARARTSISG
eukprot:scaffold13706_cov121-Isochrysis_galbana.AAC.7